MGPYPAFRDWLLAHWEAVLPTVMARMTQTNEANRCAVLLPLLSRLPGPLALIEAGASAGLCLYPDRYSYRYETERGARFLHPSDGPSTVTLNCEITSGPVPERLPAVAWRAGADLNPIDLRNPQDLDWLEALIWPEHEARRQRLRAAAQIAKADPPHLVKGDIAEGIPELVEQAPEDATVVVFHSSVLVYLAPGHRQQFIERVRSLPVTWISNEGEQVIPGLAEAIRHPALGRMVLAIDGLPAAIVGAHGQSYAGLGGTI